VARPGQGFEPLGPDRAAAAGARAERSVVEPAERSFDRLELDLVALPESEVALLLEDLGSGGCLRPVGHLARRHDCLGELRAKALPFGGENAAHIHYGLGHAAIVQAAIPSAAGAIRLVGLSSNDRLERRRFHMAIEIDPVCGMEVDTTATDLKLEHDGTVYWFCGRGCLLEFRDDPERFLDPDYKPSM
jgi:YHS domain-containing protein